MLEDPQMDPIVCATIAKIALNTQLRRSKECVFNRREEECGDEENAQGGVRSLGEGCKRDRCSLPILIWYMYCWCPLVPFFERILHRKEG